MRDTVEAIKQRRAQGGSGGAAGGAVGSKRRLSESRDRDPRDSYGGGYGRDARDTRDNSRGRDGRGERDYGRDGGRDSRGNNNWNRDRCVPLTVVLSAAVPVVLCFCTLNIFSFIK